MCGARPPQGYVCTVKSFRQNVAPQRFCDTNAKIAGNLANYKRAVASRRRSYDGEYTKIISFLRKFFSHWVL